MKLDVVKMRFWCLAFSALLILPGVVGMIYSTITTETHTPLKVGIDYTGGTTLQYGHSSARKSINPSLFAGRIKYGSSPLLKTAFIFETITLGTPPENAFFPVEYG